ncbi:AMP-binding protein [Phaeobacter inhibens]|uniref:AMP-binding protein n=1 Tax=Phaeobacter inhibens TaxID=221822 RepID=UPI0021A53FC6|nr:AMP-binding protein [Phaeobacter inhibens]UWS03089.1 AMP-binding protein [Phaeobacter inhibens]
MQQPEATVENTQKIDGSNRFWAEHYAPDIRGYDHQTRRYQRVSDILDTAVRSTPERVGFSLVLPSGHCLDKTYAEIGRASDAIACYLREDLGLFPGDVVAIQLPNSIHYPVILFGAMKAGLKVTNLNPLYTPREIVHQLQDSGAKVLFGFNLFADRLQTALKDTAVEQVVIAALWEFFPQAASDALRHTITDVAKLVPEYSFDHVPFEDALAQGMAHGEIHYDLSQIDPGSAAFLQYTGGTTGVSKGAELTHDNVTHVLEMLNACVHGAMQKTDHGQMSILTVIPYYHIFALIVNLMHFTAASGRNVLIPNPNPIANLKPAFDNYDIDWLTGVDTLFNGLMAQDWFQQTPPQIGLAIGGGTSLRPDTARRWSEQIGPIVEGYGMTETTCMIALSPLDGSDKPGTAGRPVPGLDIKITRSDGAPVGIGEAGELHVRGPNIATAYLNRPDASAETFADGWMATGDIVTMDAEGHLAIVDRKKDMILVSGFNVYPNELEAVIQSMPGVAEVAVVGEAHPTRGESPAAFVKRADPAVTEEMVIEYCRANLTAYKVPTQVHFLEELPKSSVGKILRKELRSC